MKNTKLEKVLNLLLGICWSLLTFGTGFVFLITIFSTSFSIVVISTFIMFFVSAILVVFLENIKLQIENAHKTQELLDFIKMEKNIEK